MCHRMEILLPLNYSRVGATWWPMVDSDDVIDLRDGGSTPRSVRDGAEKITALVG
jgi:hypothetical protein